MEIKAFYDTRTFTLTYVVHDPRTRDAVIIDPVLDYEPVGSHTFTESIDAVLAYVREQQLTVRWSLETHAHADHLTGSAVLARQLGARVAIGKPIVAVQQTFKSLLALDHLHTDGRQFDRLVGEGDVIEGGSMVVHVIATPGHTPACVTYRIGDALFTGDLLFMEDYGTGRCDFPAGSAADMYDSIQKLYAMPDETRVFPGHDYPPGGRAVRWETTIGASKAKNPQLDGRTARDAFIRARNARDATLSAPRLLFQSVQINIDGGRMPPADAAGRRHMSLPINLFKPADELGVRG